MKPIKWNSEKLRKNYERIQTEGYCYHRQISESKLDTSWSLPFNMTCRFLKGILVLFEVEKSFAQDMSSFYNPEIKFPSSLKAGPISYALKACNL